MESLNVLCDLLIHLGYKAGVINGNRIDVRQNGRIHYLLEREARDLALAGEQLELSKFAALPDSETTRYDFTVGRAPAQVAINGEENFSKGVWFPEPTHREDIVYHRHDIVRGLFAALEATICGLCDNRIGFIGKRRNPDCSSCASARRTLALARQARIDME